MTWIILLVSDAKHTPDGTAFEDFGLAENPAIVLIHGLGLSRHLWKPFISEFSENYRVITYDLFGHGDSLPAPHIASLEVYAMQIKTLLDHLKIKRASLVGFSIGGMINRRFAMDYPESLESLVIMNSPHDRGEEAQKLVEERAARVREQGAFSTFDDALKRWFTPDYLAVGDGPLQVRAWREMVDSESYAQAAWVLANGVRELIAPIPPIQKPALVLTCENDTGSTPKMSEDIVKEITDSVLKIVPGLQHLGLMEQPEIFKKAILDFLGRKMK